MFMMVLLSAADSLSASSRNQHWTVVRLILRQPYKKREPFGLAFVKLHGKADSSSASASDVDGVSGRSPWLEPAKPAGVAGGLVKAAHPTSEDDHRSMVEHVAAQALSDKSMSSRQVVTSTRSLLPGASTHQLATSAGSTMAKAPQRLVMSRVRRKDFDEDEPDSKRWCSDGDGVMLRSEIAKAEVLSRG